MKNPIRWLCIAGMCALAAMPLRAAADPVADFYRGKQVRIIVGGDAGGLYDIYARTLIRFLGAHFPGEPTFIPQNMQGAGGVVATNYIYGVGAQDGTIIGAVQMANPFLPLYGTQGTKYDPLKLHWLGSLSNDSNVCVSWHTSPVKTIKDLFENELIVGTAGASGANSSQMLPALLNRVLGTRFKLVAGYVGADIHLAMERGEVTGRCTSWTSIKTVSPDWIKEKKINVLVQLGLEPLEDLTNVPMVLDLAKSQEQKEIFTLIFAPQAMARPFVMGPGVPTERVQATRDAFKAASANPQLRKAFEDQGLRFALMPGERMQELIAQVWKTPQDVVKKASEAMKL